MTSTFRVDRSSSGVITLRGGVWQTIDVWRVLLSPLVFAPIGYVVARELAGLSEMLFAMGLAFSIYVLWRLSRVRDAVVAVIAENEIRVKRRLRSSSIPREGLESLFVAEIPSNSGWTECWIVGAMVKGAQQELVRTDDAPLALGLRAALERELGSPASAVPDAADRAPPAPRFPFIQLGLTLVLIGFVTWQALTAGKSIAELETGDEPTTTSFTLSTPTSLVLESEIHYADSIPAPLPRAFVYDVTVTRQGQPVTRFECDPHGAGTMLWKTGSGRHVRAFASELPGCSQQLSELGDYAITARRVWRLHRTSVKVASSKLVARAR